MDLLKLGIRITQEEKYAIWFRECYDYATKSKHPSTHNAALLIDQEKVVLKGVNNLPPGVKNKKERYEGKNKHVYPNHAERDLIYKATRNQVDTLGRTMVMHWLPCIPCANAIITSGIELLVVHKQMVERTDQKWQVELENAVQIMLEAGVCIVAYDGKVGRKAYMHRTEWSA